MHAEVKLGGVRYHKWIFGCVGGLPFPSFALCNGQYYFQEKLLILYIYNSVISGFMLVLKVTAQSNCLQESVLTMET